MKPSIFRMIKLRVLWFRNYILHRFKIQRTIINGKRYVSVICYAPMGVRWVRTFSVEGEYDADMEPIPFVADIDTGSKEADQTIIQ